MAELSAVFSGELRAPARLRRSAQMGRRPAPESGAPYLPSLFPEWRPCPA